VPGQDVEHDCGRRRAVLQGFGAGSFDGIQTVGQHGAEDVDHLAVSIGHTAELALNPLRVSQIPGRSFR